MEDDEITTPVLILLPICIELETDVFLNILKNVIGRKKLDDHYIDNALKLGMRSDKFSIEEEDISVSWREKKSRDDQIRQSKLLGYWAINNFPSLGKKLFGSSWQTPNRQSLQVVGHSKVLSAEEIDAMVFQKLKIRVMQLNVSPSTLVKINHFVNVPANIGKTNESKISMKIKSFDPYDEWNEQCWKALKLGSFSLDGNYEQIKSSQTDPSVHQEIQENEMNSRNSSRSALKRSCTQNVTENVVSHSVDDTSIVGTHTQESTIGFQSIPPSKRPYLVTKNVNSANAADTQQLNSQSSVALRRTNRETLNVNVNSNSDSDVNGYSRIDMIETVLLDIRKDTGNLTDLLHSTIADKDKEIARLNSYVHELLQTNQILTKHQMNTKEQIEGQSVLINALQKGIDANSKLLVQSERDLSASQTVIDNMRLEVTQTKNQIQNLSDNLAVSESSKLEMDAIITKLEDELNKRKDDVAKKNKECEVLRLQIDLLLPENRTKSDVETQTTTYHEVEDKLAQSERNLSESIDLIDIMKLELTQAKNQIQNLSDNLAVSESSKLEMYANITKLEDELNKWKDDATKKNKECEVLRRQIDLLLPEKSDVETQTTTDHEVEHKLAQSERDLSASLHLIDSIKLEANNQIQNLSDNLAVSENSKRDVDAKNAKLEDELNKWKDYAAKRDDELKTAQDTFAQNEHLQKELNSLSIHVDTMVPNLRSQIANLEKSLEAAKKINSESTDQTNKLQKEYEALRLQSDLLLPENRTKSDMETQTVTYHEVEIKLPENQEGVISGIEPNPNGCVSSENSNNHGLHSDAMEPVSADSANDPIGMELSQLVELHSETVFVTSDPIVQECRPVLLKLQFAWVKFHLKKNAKFYPAFIYPVDTDGKRRAQKVTRTGYVTDTKSIFFDIGDDNIEKDTSEVGKLNKLNKKFGFSLK